MMMSRLTPVGSMMRLLGRNRSEQHSMRHKAAVVVARTQQQRTLYRDGTVVYPGANQEIESDDSLEFADDAQMDTEESDSDSTPDERALPSIGLDTRPSSHTAAFTPMKTRSASAAMPSTAAGNTPVKALAFTPQPPLRRPRSDRIGSGARRRLSTHIDFPPEPPPASVPQARVLLGLG